MIVLLVDNQLANAISVDDWNARIVLTLWEIESNAALYSNKSKLTLLEYKSLDLAQE